MQISLREWLIIISILGVSSLFLKTITRICSKMFKIDTSSARAVREFCKKQKNLSIKALHSFIRKNSDIVSLDRSKILEKEEDLSTLNDQRLSKVQEGVHFSTKKNKSIDIEHIEQVLTITVVSRDLSGFKGTILLQSILESGLRFGKMDIFHRHESIIGNGEILFSMANAIKPGVFDLSNMDLFMTRAVSFFIVLPGPKYPRQAFDIMISTARKLSQELDGVLKDDQYSVLTAQAIEHYRKRISEFEHRELTKKH